MRTFISVVNLLDCDSGRKFFLQDNLNYYKTRTEDDAWYQRKHVEGNKEFFQLLEYDTTSIDQVRSHDTLPAMLLKRLYVS